jgi:hypothetical protein
MSIRWHELQAIRSEYEKNVFIRRELQRVIDERSLMISDIFWHFGQGGEGVLAHLLDIVQDDPTIWSCRFKVSFGDKYFDADRKVEIIENMKDGSFLILKDPPATRLDPRTGEPRKIMAKDREIDAQHYKRTKDFKYLPYSILEKKLDKDGCFRTNVYDGIHCVQYYTDSFYLSNSKNFLVEIDQSKK